MPLDPELARLLEREAASGLPPRSARSVELTRRLYVDSSRALGGTPVEVRIEQPRPDVRVYGEGPAVVVYFHGGRFFSGNLETHDALCRSLAAQSGCRVAAADYRLAPEHRWPAAVEDALAAVEWALERWPKVGVAGDSAGAALAGIAALAHRDRLACQLLLYPMLDPACAMASHADFASGFGPGSEDMRRGWKEYLPEGADSRDARVTPLHAPNLAGAPSAYVLTAEYDCLRDEGECYAQRLSAAGVPTVLRRYEGAIHGFLPMLGVSALARRATGEAAGWLRAQF
ncbi:MAG: alpha/beta hydrolase [Bryobacteraceae bacterium]|nr:alpha/beta hydrolase [Bryobacteraceae bacterium]